MLLENKTILYTEKHVSPEFNFVPRNTTHATMKRNEFI